MLLACTVLLGALVMLPNAKVNACSCVASFPTIADEVGASQIAFVGRLDLAEAFDPPEDEGPWWSFDRRYELVVEEAVKGVEVGDRVIMFGSTQDTSCGTSELDESIERHAILSSAYSGRFVADSTPPCSGTPTAAELLGADLTLPATSASPLSVVVAGRLGEAELIGYDAIGNPVGYGDLLGPSSQLELCPGAERFVQLEQAIGSETPILTIRDVGSLRAVDRVEIDGDPRPRDAIEQHLVQGAALTCRSADAGDVVMVLSWEHSTDGDTRILHTTPDGSVVTSVHDHASAATYDPRIDAVIAVADHELRSYDVDGAGEAIIAALTDPVTESDFDSLFLVADEADGWWIGLGDGEYELATRLRVLAHVGGDGTVERWPVEPTLDSYPSYVAADDGVLTTDQYALPLPPAGSAADGVVVVPTPPSTDAVGMRLEDGRSVRHAEGPDGSVRLRLVEPDGTAHTLQHLLEARAALGIPDGPTIDPASVDRTFRTERITSPWVLAADASTTEDPSPSTTDPQPSAPQPSDSAIAAPVTDAPVTEPDSTSEARTSSSSTSWWMAAAGVGAVVLIAFAVTRMLRRRR